MLKLRNLSFLVLLCCYLLVCVFFANQQLKNDEWRYLSYAKNLSQGQYTTVETKFLWNGPGYPLFVSFFVLLKLPIVAAKYCNALFLFFAVLFLYRTLCFYATSVKAWICAVLFGLYPPLLPELPRLLTESMSVFLISGFAYFIVRFFHKKEIKSLLAACLFGGYLILTKVIYAYVVTALIVVLLPLCFWRRDFLRSIIICVGCLMICLPYLMYTYSMTGKVFYWSNSGGTALHCMSNPNADQWGTWFNDKRIVEDERLSQHRIFLETLKSKDFVEKDMLYKQKALKNIRQHPHRYLSNFLCNVGRMWFDYPFAYKYQRPHTLFYMFPNALLLSGALFSVFPLLKSVRYLPSEILMLGVMVIVFIFGSCLIFTHSRYLVSIVPVLLLMVFYCWIELLEIRFRDSHQHNELHQR